MPMRLPAAVLATALAALGCATPVDVRYDDREDFSRYRTWDWLPGQAIVIEAAFEDERTVEALLARAVAREMEALGLSQAPGRGDVNVGVVFSGVRDVEYFQRHGAVETLTSFHETQTFETQSVTTESRVVDRCHVALYVSGARTRRLLWQASLRERMSGGCRTHLEAAVATLLERFPR